MMVLVIVVLRNFERLKEGDWLIIMHTELTFEALTYLVFHFRWSSHFADKLF